MRNIGRILPALLALTTTGAPTDRQRSHPPLLPHAPWLCPPLPQRLHPTRHPHPALPIPAFHRLTARSPTPPIVVCRGGPPPVPTDPAKRCVLFAHRPPPTPVWRGRRQSSCSPARPPPASG